MNTVTIIGRWTDHPDLRFTNDGTAVTEVAAAINTQDHTDFIPVVAFGKLATAVADHTTKGSLVGVTGRLQQNRWKTEDGNRSRVVIVARSIEFLDRRSTDGEPATESE